MSKKSKDENFNFEQALTKLESLVTKMDSDSLSLEESLKYFEEGILLAKKCQTTLEQAELKVKKLVEENGETKLEDFTMEDS